MKQFLSTKIRFCEVCQRNKYVRNLPPGELQHGSIPLRFTTYQLDISGPYPISYHGQHHILTALDEGSKLVISKAVPDLTAKTICDFIYNEFVLKFGVPITLKSDRYIAFKSRHYIELCNMLGILPHHSFAYV